MEKIPTHRSSRTAAILMAAAAVMPLASHVAHADSLVQQEIARRAAQVQEADAALLDGRKLYAEGKYEKAVAEYLGKEHFHTTFSQFFHIGVLRKQCVNIGNR